MTIAVLPSLWAVLLLALAVATGHAIRVRAWSRLASTVVAALLLVLTFPQCGLLTSFPGIADCESTLFATAADETDLLYRTFGLFPEWSAKLRFAIVGLTLTGLSTVIATHAGRLTLPSRR